MTKIDVISGFLGAGKTTLIKKLLEEAIQGEKVVLIENEFGEIGIDGGFLKDAGIEISEMNSGCICCSLVGDFGAALHKVQEQFHPDRILIEPSGVGKLSDVTKAVVDVAQSEPEMVLGSTITVTDATKCKSYMKNFGEFYNNQVENAGTIVLSRTQKLSEEKLAEAVALLREKNPTATIVTTTWDDLTGGQILEAMSQKDDFVAQLLAMAAEANAAHAHEDEDEEHEHHHHHHYDENGVCSCGHHHHDGDEDDEDEHEHHHHHDHEHEEEGACCHHDHDGHDHDGHEDHDHEHGHCCHHHHHGHDADEVFTSWGVETARTITRATIEHALDELESGKYGAILRSKGIVDGGADGWLEFDYVPGEREIRTRKADVGGKLVVIGSKLDEKGIAALFGC